MPVYRITANTEDGHWVTHGRYPDEDASYAAAEKLYPITDSMINRKIELISPDDADFEDIIEDFEMSLDDPSHESEWED